MKFCSSCGAQIHENAVICVSCGAAQTSAAPAVPNGKKFCPVCGNESIKEAVICVKCGSPFAPQTATQGRPVRQKTPASPAKIVSVIAIVLAAFGLLSILASVITLLVNSASVSPVNMLISAAVSVCTLVGFIKMKNNILPGVGYMLSAVSTFITFITNIVEYEYFSLATLISVVQIVLLALLFINKKPNGRKLWYLPVILAGVVALISIIESLADGRFEYSYYYSSSFMWEAFIPYVASLIGSVFGILVSALNAKLNWFTDVAPVQEINPASVFVPEQQVAEVPVQEPVQEYVQVPVQESAQETEI